MLLTYLDESYDRARYWLCGLVCPDDQAIPLMHALDAVVASAPGVPDQAELHGHALFHGSQEWAPFARRVRARLGVYHAALAAIAAHDVRLVLQGVDVPALRARHTVHPHAVVLQHLAERVDRLAEDRDERLLLIADEVAGADGYREHIWRFQRGPTPGYRPRHLTRIADTLHFAPSRASRLLQAADLVAFLHRRITSGVERDERAVRANAALWARIEPRVHRISCWVP
ncbi:MAG TPA: DUF3800 domain-containing protein [Mycobacteriales bacterium]|jgi:hypothetical protein|nr:DUF3800 domain-containing protein [Mycobacteriales bacterium]